MRARVEGNIKVAASLLQNYAGTRRLRVASTLDRGVLVSGKLMMFYWLAKRAYIHACRGMESTDGSLSRNSGVSMTRSIVGSIVEVAHS